MTVAAFWKIGRNIRAGLLTVWRPRALQGRRYLRKKKCLRFVQVPTISSSFREEWITQTIILTKLICVSSFLCFTNPRVYDDFGEHRSSAAFSKDLFTTQIFCERRDLCREKKTNMTGAVLDRKCALTLRITIFLHFLFILRNTETNVKSFWSLHPIYI